eukprot:6237807-Amphidinium_carterae.1
MDRIDVRCQRLPLGSQINPVRFRSQNPANNKITQQDVSNTARHVRNRKSLNLLWTFYMRRGAGIPDQPQVTVSSTSAPHHRIVCDISSSTPPAIDVSSNFVQQLFGLLCVLLACWTCSGQKWSANQ